MARLRVASESTAMVGQPVSLPPPQPKLMQLWYHQTFEPNRERWLPPDFASTELMTGTNRSIPLIPFCCASHGVVVTRVVTAGSPARTEAMRFGMSDHAQVAGGSSQMYEKSDVAVHCLLLKCCDHPRTVAVEKPRMLTEVSFAPESRVFAVPSRNGPAYWSKALQFPLPLESSTAVA